tara:strand:+ start:397 stop:840 length:444 start_codon:yes stop_codon:yes gene_type:complete
MTIKPIIFEKTKFVELTHDEWLEMFKPVKNHITKYPDEHAEYDMFETYSPEVDFVQTKIDENLVWTYGDGDMCTYISNGYGYVNRIGYYICTVPYDPEVTYQIILSTEEECTCYSEDEAVMEARGGDTGDPDCDKCEGYGYVTVYND